MDQDNAMEEDMELVVEDPTTIRKTTGILMARPRHIILRCATINPSPATNGTGRPQMIIPVTTVVNPATNPQVA
jgi:hypothetical protein